MSLRDYVVIMFSEDLALQTPAEQKEASARLWQYVKRHKELWHTADENRVYKVFKPCLTGKINLLKSFADADNTLFQPEIYRTSVNAEEKAEIEALGFMIVGF